MEIESIFFVIFLGIACRYLVALIGFLFCIHVKAIVVCNMHNNEIGGVFSPLDANHAIIKWYLPVVRIVPFVREILPNNFIAIVSGKRVRNINIWWDTCCICLMPHRDSKLIHLYIPQLFFLLNLNMLCILRNIKNLNYQYWTSFFEPEII